VRRPGRRGTSPQYALWQYSETGEIAGINDSYVDLNRFNGSDAELLTWISPPAVRRSPWRGLTRTN
jgi:GH25 family lysozyme M1 (1,4-beta-N-acetylmuramidase)